MSACGGCFITGTDTDVGKTYASVALVRALVRHGLRVAVMKPIAAGALTTPAGLRNSDATALMAAANVAADYADVNPYCLRAPVSPHIAAAADGVHIDIAHILQRFEQQSARAEWIVVEGAGGWFVPLNDRQTGADLARALGLPVVLVVGLRLGCLNHALLSARAIEAAHVPFAGWIANHIDPQFERATENLQTLERLLGSGALAYLPHAGAREPGAAASEAVAAASTAVMRLLATRRSHESPAI
ncbi:MAG TPA: dethiobiotin synthase [Steroidobacteraceae bacterium]|nr:dethiobiotin synthase [Steroidobacteraceae bacterium]